MSSPAVMPRVTVAMSVFRPVVEPMRAALASLLQQEFTDFELLVVEDRDPQAGGAALGEDVVRAFDDKRLVYVQNDAPVSLVASRNQCLSLARGELVAIADADDVFLPARLALQVQFLDAHRDVAVCGGQIEVIDADSAHVGWRSYPTEPDAVAACLRRFNPLAHPTVMFRRAVVAAVGGYSDESGSGEDYDLWSRLAVAGERLANLPDVITQYRLHEGSTKSQRLRATLDATLRVKERYWRSSMVAGDRVRMLGERVLRRLPPALVGWLFRLHSIQRRAPGSAPASATGQGGVSA